ncbi:anthocyanidin 3-O-glucosyltransferase 2-like protein [Carex littledalei]|uniref:Anthocyanidin 3-O-glucosyltransferase 2-like protein n=1 Tax=Carex littledalei TaxID=544730 RepID=A0A833V5U1_9POAL|nr:anthocyanidin 3-O-glucosyltransferase 2-like protein [Carex littledalei]
MSNNRWCLFFMPIWPPGHTIPMVEAAKRLLQCNSTSSNSLSITFLLMQTPTADSMSNITESYLRSVDSLNLPINFQQLPVVKPPAQFDDPEEFITIYVKLHLPHVKDAIATSGSRVAALVLDPFATSLIDLGNELNIPCYIFHTSNAAFLSLVLHLPILDEKIKQEFSEIDGPIKVPGVLPVPSHFMPPILMNKKSGAYKSFLYLGRRYMEAKGIIVNSSIALEERVLKAVEQGQCAPDKPAPAIYPIGPIVSIPKVGPEQHECVKWLDLQQPKSVIFLCFGSRGGFELPQIKEMAIGLERSGHRFLWAIRAPCTGIK